MLPAEQSPWLSPLRASRRRQPPIWVLRSSIFRAGCAREPARLSTAPVKTAEQRCRHYRSAARCRPGAHPGHAPGRRKGSPHLELLDNGIDLGYVPDAQLAPRRRASPPYRQWTHRRRLRRYERPARRRRSHVDGRVLWQRGRPPLRRRRRRPAPPARACRGTRPGTGGHCHRRHGGRVGERYRRSGELSGHRRSHQRGLLAQVLVA